MNEKAASPAGIGVLSILTVLLVLCLTVFSALTLTSAKADLALSKKNADMVAAYYTADAAAVRQYASLVDEAASAPAHTGGTVERTIPMTDSQSLYIHLSWQAGEPVDILAWRTVLTERGETTIDAHLPVWDGTLPSG